MLNRSCILLLLAIAACSDRSVTPPIDMSEAPRTVGRSDGRTVGPPVELAQMVAKGLKNPAFRAYIKAQLDASPYREHKLEFERFLTANSGHALR